MVYIVFYRPFGNSSIIREKEITFTSVKVEGGGVLEINSNGRGMVLRGGTLEVQSGGVVVVDRIDIQVSRLIVDSSAHIHADGKVRKKTVQFVSNIFAAIHFTLYSILRFWRDAALDKSRASPNVKHIYVFILAERFRKTLNQVYVFLLKYQCLPNTVSHFNSTVLNISRFLIKYQL